MHVVRYDLLLRKRTPYSFEEIISQIENYGIRHICITGGEPLLQKQIIPFMEILCAKGYIVSLETGGSLPTEHVPHPVIVILDIKCPGSGMESKNFWGNIGHLKTARSGQIRHRDRTDYDYAKEIVKKYRLETKVEHLLFSPVHNVLDPKELVNWILEDRLPVRLNLQIHKYIWTPTTGAYNYG